VLRQAVLEGVDSGELRCPNVEVAMLCLRGILNHATVWIRSGDDAALRKDVVDCALRLFV
jgi:hypothetical protein